MGNNEILFDERPQIFKSDYIKNKQCMRILNLNTEIPN